MFSNLTEDYATVKFFGTFAVKDNKIYITIPDYIMYNFTRIRFYDYIQGLHRSKLFDLLKERQNALQKEIKQINKAFDNFVRNDSRREAVIKT